MPTINIIGAGRIGSAIGGMLKAKGIEVGMWDKNPTKCVGYSSCDECVKNADILFLGIPCTATREILKEIAPVLKKETIVVSFAKGIEEDTLKTTNQIAEELLPKTAQFTLIQGPMLAEEMERGFIGGGVCATKEQKTFETLAELFKGTPLLLRYSPDIKSVGWGGILKNIYAIGAGILDGTGDRGNAKGIFIVHAIKEMKAIIRALGGDESIIETEAGLGDLIATGFSVHSRHRRIGEMMAKEKIKEEGDGMSALRALPKILKDQFSAFLLLSAIYEVMEKGGESEGVYRALSHL